MRLCSLRQAVVKFGVLFLFAGLAAISRCAAQEDSDLMSVNLEELRKVKVYSASRHLEDVHAAPSAVSIITADEIRRYGWRTLGDALVSLRGFYSSYDRQYMYVGVRGFQRPADYNSRILLLLNGHRMNENIYGSAEVGADFQLDIDLIDHIEVVRGPGSSLFGMNAMFGVINVVTRKPSGNSVEVAGETGSNWSRGGRVSGFVKKGATTALLSASAARDPGVPTLYFQQFDSPSSNYGYARNQDGERYDNAFVDLQHGGFRLQTLFADHLKQFPTGSFGWVFPDPAALNEDVRGFADASYHRALGASTQLDVRAYYDEYNWAGSYTFLDDTTSAPTVNAGVSREDRLGTESTIEKELGAQRITLGTSYEYNLELQQKNYAPGQPPSLDVPKSPSVASVFGETELNLVRDVTLHVGARVDDFSTFGATVSPRVAAVYQPNKKTALKYIFGRAFRPPSAYEEYFYYGVSTLPPPKELQPEQIQSHDLVLDRDLKRWLRFTADAYYNQIQQLIDYVTSGDGLTGYYANAGRVQGDGAEVELAGESLRGLAGRISYSWSNTRDEVTRDTLENSPVSLVKLNGTFPLKRSAFLGFELQSTGPEQSYQGTRVPPAFLANANLTSKPWHGWTLAVSSYNVLDRRWYSPMSPNDPEDKILMDGRTLRLKIWYHAPAEKKP